MRIDEEVSFAMEYLNYGGRSSIENQDYRKHPAGGEV